MQDVFLAAWRSAGRFDPARGRASTWLYRIAANRCIDVRRWRRFRTFVGLEGGEEQLLVRARRTLRERLAESETRGTPMEGNSR